MTNIFTKICGWLGSPVMVSMHEDG